MNSLFVNLVVCSVLSQFYYNFDCETEDYSKQYHKCFYFLSFPSVASLSACIPYKEQTNCQLNDNESRIQSSVNSLLHFVCTVLYLHDSIGNKGGANNDLANNCEREQPPFKFVEL